jgi:pimeloyl-ACP methyl ester carboxylesterase
MATLPSAFKTPQGEATFLAAYEATMRLWPVAYEPLDLRSRFGSTHLVVCGPEEAPPLVLLHCYFLSLASWAYNIAALSRDHRVYALDVMGQPSKSIPDQPIRNREELADWLTGVLDALGIGQTDLLGYSFGGFAGLNYAIREPDRVKRLVVLCPAGGLAPLKASFLLRGMVSGLTSILLPRLTPFTAGMMMRFMTYGPSFRDERTRRLIDRMTQQLALGNRYFRVGPQIVPFVFTDAELRSVRQPTLLLIGRQEALIDPALAGQRAQQLMPDIQADLIPHAGHELPVSQPETVNQRILAFLEAGAASVTGDAGRPRAASPALVT